MDKKASDRKPLELNDIEDSLEFQRMLDEFNQEFFDEHDPAFAELLRKHSGAASTSQKGEAPKEIVSSSKNAGITPIRATYRIRNWAHWDREIDEAVTDFRERAGKTPNIFIAAEQTHRRIDIAANSRREKILGPGNLPVPESEGFAAPSAFRGMDYELEFCMDDSLPLDHFLLVFDSDPDGGLPLPDEDNLPLPREENARTKRRAIG